MFNSRFACETTRNLVTAPSPPPPRRLRNVNALCGEIGRLTDTKSQNWNLKRRSFSRARVCVCVWRHSVGWIAANWFGCTRFKETITIEWNESGERHECWQIENKRYVAFGRETHIGTCVACAPHLNMHERIRSVVALSLEGISRRHHFSVHSSVDRELNVVLNRHRLCYCRRPIVIRFRRHSTELLRYHLIWFEATCFTFRIRTSSACSGIRN